MGIAWVCMWVLMDVETFSFSQYAAAATTIIKGRVKLLGNNSKTPMPFNTDISSCSIFPLLFTSQGDFNFTCFLHNNGLLCKEAGDTVGDSDEEREREWRRKWKPINLKENG